MNLGVFLCLNCAGKHRSYGVHASFVRSMTLDKWTSKQVEFMRLGGNERARNEFERAGHPIPDTHGYNCQFVRDYRQKLKEDVYKSLGLPMDAEDFDATFESDDVSQKYRNQQAQGGEVSAGDVFGEFNSDEEDEDSDESNSQFYYDEYGVRHKVSSCDWCSIL